VADSRCPRFVRLIPIAGVQRTIRQVAAPLEEVSRRFDANQSDPACWAFKVVFSNWRSLQRVKSSIFLETRDVPNHDLPATVLTVIKKGIAQWIIRASDFTEQGPYHSAIVVLQVAALAVWSARKRGLKGDLFVQDDHGLPRLCGLINKADGTAGCAACQSSWTATHSVRPKCPLWEELGGR
jgi:hypothetical protein